MDEGFGSQIRLPGIAWVSLCLAVALHVADEAANGFLDVYNPAVLQIRQQLPFLPMPTFRFETWMAGLTLAVLLGLALSPFVFRRAQWTRTLVVAIATLMLINAVGHF
ncbi:MAG: hypothetical protein JSW71_02900, partial [Gemmatimonadota bacterium]